MVAGIRQVANHEPEVRNTGLPVRSLELALLINAPDGPALVGYLVAEGRANRVDSVGEASREDNQVGLALTAAVEDDLVLSKALDVARLDLNPPVDDVLACTRVKVEAAVAGLAQSRAAGPALAAPRAEPPGPVGVAKKSRSCSSRSGRFRSASGA